MNQISNDIQKVINGIWICICFIYFVNQLMKVENINLEKSSSYDMHMNIWNIVQGNWGGKFTMIVIITNIYNKFQTCAIEFQVQHDWLVVRAEQS